MKTIEIRGETIVLAKVTGVSKLKTISTGSMHCDWCWGFEVYTEGNSIEIRLSEDTNSQKEEAKEKYTKLKNKILEAI